MKLLIILFTLMLIGCGGETNYLPVGPGRDSLIDTTQINTDSCKGIMINTGLDIDYDSILDDFEIRSSSLICNGIDGQDAETFDFTISSVVDPCGDGPGLDEVLLITNEGVMAWYKNTGLVLLPNGSYETTDNQECNFTVLNGEVI